MMKETEPFAPSVPAGQTSFMTTREVAETLEVSTDAILKTAKKLFNPTAVHRRVINGGKSMIFNAEQVTAIKEELMRHHNIKSEMPEKMQTELSIMHRVADGFAALKEWNTSLQQQLSEEKRKNEEMRPKAELADKYLDRKMFYSFTDASHVLGIGRKELMTLLKSKYIYEVPNCKYSYRPYADYKKYFERRPFGLPGGKAGFQLMMNLRGLEFFGRILKAKEEKEIGNADSQ